MPAADDRDLRATPHPPVPADAPADPGRYRLYPHAPLPEGRIDVGHEAVAAQLTPVLARGATVLLDGTTGVLWETLRDDLEAALATHGIHASWWDVRAALRDQADLDELLAPYLTDDPVFGTRYPGELCDLFDAGRLDNAATHAAQGNTIAFGPGAGLLADDLSAETLLAYVEVPKNEAQYRARAGSVTNLGKARADDPKAMYKRFYFVDWPVLKRHGHAIWPRVDLVIDAQRPRQPSCATGEAVRAGLRALTERPFRPRPWVEPGAWGGHAIEALVPELPRDVPNYAWSFELIAPENGVLLEAGGRLLEVSLDRLMGQAPDRMLGAHTDAYGDVFPIRFDFLDTVGGGNLSLQVHPSRAYIQERFGEPYLTQDETYYLLDAEPDAEVFLGFQEGVDPRVFREALERSRDEGTAVDVRRFVRAHPARKHDLFLIPHGTVHCSGAGNLVLEISSTPYIFTFKLYDWLRLDLDGRPRPLNVERAFENLDFTRAGETVDDTLLVKPRVLRESDDGRVVHLPTHPQHGYDVHRLELTGSLETDTDGSPRVLSLVEGSHVEIEAAGVWQTFHYAETVLLPAAVGRYRVRSPDGAPIRVVEAFLKPAPTS